MLPPAQYWVDTLQMQPHPEGGFYKETYRSDGVIQDLQRNYATAIYFLLLEDQFSAFHRIRSDEMWHFYAGDPLNIYVIDQQGHLQVHRLGNAFEQGAQFQFVVPGGCWFASRMAAPHTYALVGCTVAPGFDFRDFEMADRQKLIDIYPQHAEIIRELTYGN